MNDSLEQLPIPLLEWYREYKRDLPWRENPAPYRVWVSEIMLQQTRVHAALGYYERFLEECPTVADLANLPEERLMKLWQGLGYYNRVRSMQRAARMIVEEYAGELPADYEAIRALPGVGDYTAGAICSIAFGLPTPAVDGNVLRVTARVLEDEGDVTSTAMKRKVTQALRQVIPTQAPGEFNQALMELGATICLPNGAPLCKHCPINHLCRAFQTGRTGELPVKAPKKARRVEERDVYLIFFDHRVALRRRPKHGLLAGLWEFPNEFAPSACPVFGWELQKGAGKHIFSHVEWHMKLQAFRAASDELPAGWVWARKWELDSVYAIPSAFACCKGLLDEYLSPREW